MVLAIVTSTLGSVELLTNIGPRSHLVPTTPTLGQLGSSTNIGTMTITYSRHNMYRQGSISHQIH